MISVWRRLAGDLRTVAVGGDPAVPVPPPRRGRAAAGVVALLGLAAVVARHLQDDRQLPLVIAAVLGVLSVAPVLLLWRSPLWAWRLAFVALFPGAVDHPADQTWPWNPLQVLMTFTVLFVLALREPLGVTVLAGLATLAPVWLFLPGDAVIGVTVLVGVVLGIGQQIEVRRRTQRELRVESERSEQLTERARIARELHDVVAHSMSLVAVRAETAPYRLPELPEPAREEFVALAATARETLTELRRLLGVLRTDAEPARVPQPALSDLVGSMRAAGVQVELVDAPVSPTIGLTVYRIVQEALSNATRHAPGAPVTVAVKPEGERLTVRVHNGPPGRPVTGPSTGGHGLRGMRERAELLGGAFHAGPAPDGGFLVEVSLPHADPR